MEPPKLPSLSLANILLPPRLLAWLNLLGEACIDFCQKPDDRLEFFSKFDVDKVILRSSPSGTVSAQCKGLFAQQVAGLDVSSPAAERPGLLSLVMLRCPRRVASSPKKITFRLGYTGNGCDIRITLRREPRKRARVPPEMRDFIAPGDASSDDECSWDEGGDLADDHSDSSDTDDEEDTNDDGAGWQGLQSQQRSSTWAAVHKALRKPTTYCHGVLKLIDKVASPHARASLVDFSNNRVVLEGAQAAFWWVAQQHWWMCYLHDHPVSDLVSVEGDILATLGGRRPVVTECVGPLLSPLLPTPVQKLAGEGAAFSCNGGSLLIDLGTVLFEL